MQEEVEIRVHGSPEQPTLVYLPGLHGDWTLIGGLRRALAGRVRFVECTYPRTLTWSLEDYAAGVERSLQAVGISSAWFIAESFGSQVVWPIAHRNRDAVQGIVLAGGFGRHPMRWLVRLGEVVAGGIPLKLLISILFGYARIARHKHRHRPEVLASIDEFLERRTELDRQAARHRLWLIARNDPCSIAAGLTMPVYALSGLVDPIVPWFLARRWLKKNCPALKAYRVIRTDHNVLSTASRIAADQILTWVGQQRFQGNP
jgi:pimeloyl-ACP methyl ester carboxylesterase